MGIFDSLLGNSLDKYSLEICKQSFALTDIINKFCSDKNIYNPNVKGNETLNAVIPMLRFCFEFNLSCFMQAAQNNRKIQGGNDIDKIFAKALKMYYTETTKILIRNGASDGDLVCHELNYTSLSYDYFEVIEDSAFLWDDILPKASGVNNRYKTDFVELMQQQYKSITEKYKSK